MVPKEGLFNLWFVGPALYQLSYSGERLVVGVGIEPTFRVFQTRANPSQLSDRRMNWPQMNTDHTDKKLHFENDWITSFLSV